MAISDVLERIRELGKHEVKAGFLDTSKYADGTPVAEVAAMNEFGHITDLGYKVPPRPFLRPSIANYAADWVQVAREGIDDVITHGLDPVQVYERMGLSMAGDIVKQITEPDKIPLSRVTLLLRKWRDDGRTIDNAAVLAAVATIQSNPNVTVSTNKTPLDDSGYMIASVQHEVYDK
jgi:hypothetical protein